MKLYYRVLVLMLLLVLSFKVVLMEQLVTELALADQCPTPKPHYPFMAPVPYEFLPLDTF